MFRVKQLLVPFCMIALVSFGVASERHVEGGSWEPFDVPLSEFDVALQGVSSNGPRLISLEFTPYRNRGDLRGCGYAYRVLLRDWAYRANAPTVAYGSVVLFVNPDGAPVLSHRIGLTDIQRSEGRLWQQDSSVSYSYLRWNDLDTIDRERSILDGEGGTRLFSYAEPDVQTLEWLILPDTLTIAFNREPGGTDLEFEVPLMGSDAWLSLAPCVREMLRLDEMFGVE
jgi:hypothetical protein